MTLYIANVVVPANTPQSAPTRTTIHPNELNITEVEVLFPPGSAGLVGVRFLERGSRFAPGAGSSDAWIVGDSETIRWPEERGIQSPAELVIEAYNLDTTYQHTAYCRVDCKNYLGDSLMISLIQMLGEFTEKVGRLIGV